MKNSLQFISFYKLIFCLIATSISFSELALCQLPTEIPGSIAGLESANRQIAEFFAPTIRHMAETDLANSVNGRADLLTSVFYDDENDFNTGDNWDNCVR